MSKKPAAMGTNVVHPNVSRVDYGHNHGYFVRLQRKGKETNKLFSDSAYGSKRKARLAAIVWREETASKLGPLERGGGVKPPGYSYIKRMLAFNYLGGARQEFKAWVGFLRIEHRGHLSTKWSIEKWGDKEARRRCEGWLLLKKTELAFRLARARSKPMHPKSKTVRSRQQRA